MIGNNLDYFFCRHCNVRRVTVSWFYKITWADEQSILSIPVFFRATADNHPPYVGHEMKNELTDHSLFLIKKASLILFFLHARRTPSLPFFSSLTKMVSTSSSSFCPDWTLSMFIWPEGPFVCKIRHSFTAYKEGVYYAHHDFLGCLKMIFLKWLINSSKFDGQ